MLSKVLLYEGLLEGWWKSQCRGIHIDAHLLLEVDSIIYGMMGDSESLWKLNQLCWCSYGGKEGEENVSPTWGDFVTKVGAIDFPSNRTGGAVLTSSSPRSGWLPQLPAGLHARVSQNEYLVSKLFDNQSSSGNINKWIRVVVQVYIGGIGSMTVVGHSA